LHIFPAVQKTFLSENCISEILAIIPIYFIFLPIIHLYLPFPILFDKYLQSEGTTGTGRGKAKDTEARRR
jgi:hypothetical protein